MAMQSEGRKNQYILHIPSRKVDWHAIIKTRIMKDWSNPNLEAMVAEAKSNEQFDLSQFDCHFVLKDGLFVYDNLLRGVVVLMGISYNFQRNAARIEVRGNWGFFVSFV